MNPKEHHNLDLPVIVVGNGGHARAVSEVISQLGWKRISFTVTNSESQANSTYHNLVDPPIDWRGYFFIAIGDNKARQQEFDRFLWSNKSAKSLTVISPQSNVASTAKIGEGSVVMPFCSINAYSRVGRGSIVNTGAIIEHDAEIGEFVSVAPGVVTGGGVSVGDFATIGLGAVISNGVSVGAESVLGANSLLLQDLPSGARALGSPARVY